MAQEKVQEKIRERLYAPDMFFCERCLCRVSKAICLKRQQLRVRRPWRADAVGEMAFPACQGCVQGFQNRLEALYPAAGYRPEMEMQAIRPI